MAECTCPSECTCLCAELKALKKQVDSLIQEHDRVLVKEIVPERKRITKIEKDIDSLKDSIRQITVFKTEGSRGIVDKRADIIFSRLLAFPSNGNGKKPYFSTLDVKSILGVRSYEQSKRSMQRCVERYPGQVMIIQRGPRKLGISLVDKEGIKM